MTPPYAADTRAKGWRFEIDTEAVKASDTWLRARTGAIKGALLLLWSEAWQQTPCGSLPDDDELLALLIDMPPDTFAANRAVLMRGWARADDGRLYHETITKRVLAMLVKRAKDAKRTADRRAHQAESEAINGGEAGVSHVTTDGQACDPPVSSTPSTKHQAPAKDQAPSELSDTPLRVVSAPPAFDGNNSKAIPGKALVLLAAEFDLPAEWGVDAEALGFPRSKVLFESERFRQYWATGKGMGKRKTIRGWRQSWSNWLGKAAERAA